MVAATDGNDPETPQQRITDCIETLRVWSDIDKEQRQREEEDLCFQEADGSWPQEIRDARGPIQKAGKMPALPGRPMLSVASLDEPLELVDADCRRAHLGVTCHALTEDATDETAQILTAIYRGIERDSNAARQRNWGAKRAARAGRGAYRVAAVYDPEGGHPLDQKLQIQRILFQENVWFDPFAQKEDWSDGMRAMEIEDVPWVIYKRRYKKSSLSTAVAEELQTMGETYPNWVRYNGETPSSTTIRVVRDWCVEIQEVEQVLLDNNELADADKIPAGRTKHPTDEREVPKREIRRVYTRVQNCKEELEPKKYQDCKYIPLIPCIGRELTPVKGRRKWIGMIANAKGAVRLTNYAASNAIEMAALEPRAPWQLDPKQIEGLEDFWDQSNVRNWPFLPSHQYKDGQRYDRPQRTPVDTSRMGPSMSLLQMGRDFVRTATGMQSPALGENQPAHRSGRAIANLQAQSLQGTSIYLDNEAEVSMPYEALVILDWIPHIYDRPGRLARIVEVDQENKETSSLVMLNAPHVPGKMPQALPYDTDEQKQLADANVQNPDHPAKNYDLKKGRYGIAVQIQKAHPTRLAEGSDKLSMLMEGNPELVPVLGPEWARFQDFPGAKQVQQVLQKMRDHSMPWLASDPTTADVGRLTAENQALKQQLAEAAKVIETKQVEGAMKHATAQMQEQYETLRAAMERETKLAVAEIQSKAKDLALFYEERARVGIQDHEATEAAKDRAHEAVQNDMERSHAADQADQDRAHEAATSALGHEQTMRESEQDGAQQAALAEQAHQHALETPQPEGEQ